MGNTKRGGGPGEEEGDTVLGRLKRDKYRLEFERETLEDRIGLLREQVDTIGRELTKIDERIEQRKKENAGELDISEAVADVQFDIVLREVASGLPPDRRVRDNPVVREKSREIGTTPDRFIRLMNDRYPWEQFDQSPETHYDIYDNERPKG